MSRDNNRTGRSDKAARHVRLYYWFMESDAWKSLDATARALYVEIVARYGGPGSNNGRISYSVREAALALGIGKSRAAQAFAELQRRGFIVATQRGTFNRKVRHATEWRMTEYPSDLDGMRATKEFMRWRASETGTPRPSVVPLPGNLTSVRPQVPTYARKRA